MIILIFSCFFLIIPIFIHDTEVDKVVEKFKKRQKAMSELKPQRGKPSWANNEASKGPNSASSDKTRIKRRLSIGDGIGVSDEKRPRHDNSKGLEQSPPQHSPIEL